MVRWPPLPLQALSYRTPVLGACAEARSLVLGARWLAPGRTTQSSPLPGCHTPEGADLVGLAHSRVTQNIYNTGTAWSTAV